VSVPRPYLSVIVPAHQAMGPLRQSLEALGRSGLPREAWELIVADDASTDETSLVAAEYADTVVRLSGKPNGPAYARNRAFEASRGEVLVFVDSDVVVHPDALPRIVRHLKDDPSLSAVFGAYDANPTAPGLVSQYRNLLHHYVHVRNRGPAETFWAGIGAIRRDAFAEVGMFDEWSYANPQIEDIELGRRLRRLGRRILLDPDIQGTHLKRWTLKGTLLGDFRNRGVPWMWLLLQEGTPESSRTLNVRTAEKWTTAAVGLAVALATTAIVVREDLYAWCALVAPAAILATNWGFYRFLANVRGVAFAAAVMPLHLLYYVGNGVSALSGWMVHVLFGEPIPSAAVAALAQAGVKTWPPPPSRPSTSLWDEPEREHRPVRRKREGG